MRPSGVKFTKSHEWVRTSGDEATVGITDYAQDELGDIVAVDLPAVGKTVTAGEPFGTVDSVKAVSDLMSPVTGEVIAVNENLTMEPESINSDPFGEGWMLVVRISDTAALEGLMTADEYETFLKQE